MNNVNPFGSSFSVPYHNVGREEIPKKKRYKRNVGDINGYHAGDFNIRDQEEIDICLNCPYDDCRSRCSLLMKHRAKKREEAYMKKTEEEKSRKVEVGEADER